MMKGYPEKRIKEIVSDEEMQNAFHGSNFGAAEPREILADTVLKIAGGYSTGNTAMRICQELGLLGRKMKPDPRLTKRGREYLYRSHCGEK
jgi:hypothetical protein